MASVAIVVVVLLGYGLVWSILHGPPEAAALLAMGAVALSLITLGILLETRSDLLMACGILATGIVMLALSSYLIVETFLGNPAVDSGNGGWWVLLLLIGIVVSLDGWKEIRRTKSSITVGRADADAASAERRQRT